MSFKMVAVVKGGKEFQQKIEKAGKKFPKTVTSAMWKSVHLVVRTAKKKLTLTNPLTVRTGRLRSSVHGQVKQKGIHAEGIVGTDVFYGKVHEEGATIFAKRAEYMIFFYKGQWMKKEKVVIPARPWLNPSLTENRPLINRIFEGEVKTLLSDGKLS